MANKIRGKFEIKASIPAGESYEDVKVRVTLPCNSANTKQAETTAVRSMDAINAMLEFSKSRYRIVPWDTETDKRAAVDRPPSPKGSE